MCKEDFVNKLKETDVKKYESAVDAVLQEIALDLRHHVKLKLAVRYFREFFEIEKKQDASSVLLLLARAIEKDAKVNQESIKH